ncbi:S-layer homology domain-containing protein [Tepidanaerobacter syntrophicus]|uniref:S-layer homology domain-containing protein n=1 Tax=Tepidanaerobacter syntrophicus TaxID=224999 RepID=UPI001BD3CAD1|nr:S-layer homology domain-containing protein [Tepidanaerobacter syntrophicus]
MKKAKKLLVTLLVFAFVLSTFTVGFAATSSSAKVTDENLPKEVVRAMALGYLKGDDQGNLNLDKPITRAEALAIIIRISGLETSADLMKGQTKFADVNADPSLQWATGYINLGVGQGIINGYPDGTFRGNANVTYAEMAKMLIYAMNYGVTVEGAPWPAGVMGKADDLGLFDDVNASPDVPAIRGDVVMMVDNSLTVAHLKQTGYGDLKQYEEDPDTTFLSKMKIDELEDARVTAIARVDSTLEDDEIELTTYDSKGNVEDSDVYTLLTDETPEALFGLKVDAWINDDDEIVFVDVATNAKDILLDTVAGTPAKDEIELKVADDTFDVVTDAEAYVNFSTVADFSKLEAGMYGKFVRESGKIAFANLFDFDKKGIVTEVDKNVISFVDAANGDDDEIDLDDYDDVYVYNPDFSKADVKDIKEYSAIFFWEDDDEINIVVKNDSVEGKVDAVKADSIKIDGTWYDKGVNAIVTLDKGDNYDVWEDNNGLDIVEDFVDEDVTAVLDLNGEVMLVTGAAKATSGDLYGIVTYAKDGRYVTLTVFNKDGEEVDYTAESSNEFRDLVGLDYYATGSNVEYAALKYKLTSDSEIAKEKSVVAEIKGTDCTDAYPANTPTTSLLNSEVFEGNLRKGSDKKNITVDGKTFYIASDTVIMQALNNDGELDPSLITVDKFVSLSIENNNEAVVFGENGKDAKFIVMLNEKFEGAEEDLYYGVVTDKPYKSGGSYYATINVFGEGEKDYMIDDAADFPKAKVVCFKFNNKGEATIYEDAVTNKEYSYDDGYVTIKDNGTYKVDSSAILYSLDGSDIDKKISRTALKDYKYINYVLDDSNVIVAATVSEKKTTDENETTTGEVTYINATRIFIDGEKYAMDEDTILYDTDGSTIKAVGGEEIIDPQGGNLEQGDIVKDVKVENGVVTKMTFVKKASDVTAEQELQEAIEDLIEGVELTATVDNTNAEVSASFEYPQTINVTALTNYKIDVLITLGEALPAGTKVDIDYNSSTVATNVDVAGEDKAFLSDLLNQQPVPISTAHQGLTESWDLTIDGNLEPIKTTATVKVIIATDFDDEDTWVVLADGTVNLDFAVDQNALDAAKQAAVTAVFSATNKYAMKTALEDNAKLLGLDMSVYNTLSGSDKLAVAQYVVDQALTTTNDLDLDIAAIQQAFADGVDIVQ